MINLYHHSNATKTLQTVNTKLFFLCLLKFIIYFNLGRPGYAMAVSIVRVRQML